MRDAALHNGRTVEQPASLEMPIHNLTQLYTTCLTDQTRRRLEKACLDLRASLPPRRTCPPASIKYRHYEQGKKADKLVVVPMVSANRGPRGCLLMHFQGIADAFADYYRNLYTLEMVTDVPCIHRFLGGVTLPQLNEDEKVLLLGPATKEEIEQVISAAPYS
ncbi:hypothetical protein NDU88_001050 [Pleurodeles waltl]|uniref:Uncharacterized protein n=1 Tax=Pleurodeles waltl TaxID=8319 RepID=A0AAV7P499_PLEWA|nr:hypothetical protein NDU88_001050 [Pleurodeles waltl]